MVVELDVAVTVVPVMLAEVTVVRCTVVVSLNSVSVVTVVSVTVAVPVSTVVVVVVVHVIAVAMSVDATVLADVLTILEVIVDMLSSIRVLVVDTNVVTVTCVAEGMSWKEVTVCWNSEEHTIGRRAVQGDITKPIGWFSFSAVHELMMSGEPFTQTAVDPMGRQLNSSQRRYVPSVSPDCASIRGVPRGHCSRAPSKLNGAFTRKALFPYVQVPHSTYFNITSSNAI